LNDAPALNSDLTHHGGGVSHHCHEALEKWVTEERSLLGSHRSLLLLLLLGSHRSLLLLLGRCSVPCWATLLILRHFPVSILLQ
jgi:hypothetical protein